MATRNSTERVALGDGGDEPSNGRFRLAVAVYAGVLLAGVVSVAAVLTAFVPGPLLAVYAAGFAVGFGGGLALAAADPRLPVRLGRTLGRRAAVVVPTVPFAVVWFAPLEAAVDVVALWAVITVFASGYVLSQLAGNRYVDAVTPGEPAERWRWTPPGSPVVDALIAGMWLVIGIGNAVTGSPAQGLLWLALAVFWVASCLIEGRWSFGPGRDRCEVQLYETGLVKRRPYTKTYVSWSDIDHARLREGELVLDRGLRDVRFDSDELGDPDAVLEAVDRWLETSAER
ncbi:hypothetical protein HTZ84_16825 [Haloterrigena sp. SYSU A558-1]|uniref:PH domain-containing protein n=1 Tax=Haloterrigena gelatinilytica TaxID=2741724 RepID=A0ABX2LCE4_9EURY|nr:hypothetical protein [Haloterrigena gelatinilytica]NUC73944.1 hypothetical protein [Haloterrigena gelatinilytica]